MSCTDSLRKQFLFLTKTGHWQSPWCCLSTQKMWQSLVWEQLCIGIAFLVASKLCWQCTYLNPKEKKSDFWKSSAFYPPCSDPIFWSSCRFCAVELFGEAGPGRTANWAGSGNLCPLVEYFDTSNKEKKSLFSSMLYQDNCKGKCYTREFSCLKCVSLDGQYKILSIFT